jgi:hypothetical protein
MKASDRYFVHGVSCSLHGQRVPVANLSVGGLFAATPDPPTPGQVIDLELDLNGRAFAIRGLVAWVNPQDRPRSRHLPHGCGIKITKIAFTDKLALLELLKRAAAAHPTALGAMD